MDLTHDETIFPSALMQCIGFEEVLSMGTEGAAEVRFRARPEFAHSHGTTVQGGIVTAWLDCAMAWAVHARDPARSIATLDISVKYLARVSVDAHVCRARVVKWGRSVAFLEADLYDAAGKCLTRSTSTGLLLEMAKA